MTAAFVVVLADGHPTRDGWVDEQARAALPDLGVGVGDATYRGLWRLPVPERTVVHLFADRFDVEQVRRQGLEPVEP